MDQTIHARALLRTWLEGQLDAADRDWLAAQFGKVSGTDKRALYAAFALTGRRLGKAALVLTAADQADAEACIAGWMPGAWSRSDAGRILLLCTVADDDFVGCFRALCQTADVAEAVALYRGLPLYPRPALLEPQVGEGLRGNMRSVFEAIAQHNPYPRRYFDEHRWNHMVVKAVFIGSRLAPIQGLDARANPELARILLDFVHERRAAGREVPFDIWRCVGPCATVAALDDLGWALATGSPVQRAAAALALASATAPEAAELLRRAPGLAAEIAAGRLTWGMLQ